MQNIKMNINEFDAVLGTPTAQKLIRFLVVWPSLSVQDLVNKSNISKSQIHITLKNLITHSMVISPSRGIYALSGTPFARSLKDAYHIKIVEQINSQIYHIKQLLKKKKISLAEDKFQELVTLYQPILHESFSTHLSSLSLRFIEKIGEKQ